VVRRRAVPPVDLRAAVLRARVEVLRRVPVERARVPVARRVVLRARVPVARRAVPVVRRAVLRARVVVRRAVPVARRRVVPVARRAVLRARVVVRRAVPAARRVVLRARVPVARARVPVARRVVLRARVPVARLRAVVRPPLAAAARVGALRVVVRRVPVVDRAREVVERRRVPPVEREREVVLPELDFFARLVVDFLRPRLDAALTLETLSFCGCSSGCCCCCGGCCMGMGVSSGTSIGDIPPPYVCPSKLDICPPIGRFPLPTCPSACRHPPVRRLLAQRLRRACRLLQPQEDGALCAWP
jgi:hypothetical protein